MNKNYKRLRSKKRYINRFKPLKKFKCLICDMDDMIYVCRLKQVKGKLVKSNMGTRMSVACLNCNFYKLLENKYTKIHSEVDAYTDLYDSLYIYNT